LVGAGNFRQDVIGNGTSNADEAAGVHPLPLLLCKTSYGCSNRCGCGVSLSVLVEGYLREDDLGTLAQTTGIHCTTFLSNTGACRGILSCDNSRKGRSRRCGNRESS
jgi:hypothetical protein